MSHRSFQTNNIFTLKNNDFGNLYNDQANYYKGPGKTKDIYNFFTNK